MLKKYITASLMAMMLAVTVPVFSGTATAQSRYCSCASSRRYAARRHRYRSNRYTAARRSYYSPAYASTTTSRQYYTYKRPGFYSRHRQLVNIAAGSGIGALVGGLLGGRRGVAIGGLAGAGGGYYVTHKQRPRNYSRPVYYRNY